jgi:hypothetical protein
MLSKTNILGTLVAAVLVVAIAVFAVPFLSWPQVERSSKKIDVVLQVHSGSKTLNEKLNSRYPAGAKWHLNFEEIYLEPLFFQYNTKTQIDRRDYVSLALIWPSLLPARATAGSGQRNGQNQEVKSVVPWPYFSETDSSRFYFEIKILARPARNWDEATYKAAFSRWVICGDDPVKQRTYYFISETKQCDPSGERSYVHRVPSGQPAKFSNVERMSPGALSKRWSFSHADHDGWSLTLHIPISEIDKAPTILDAIKQFLDANTTHRDSLANLGE